MTDFTCNDCGRRFVWKPALAGRLVRCPCGVDLRCPLAETAAAAPAPLLPYRAVSPDGTDFDTQAFKDLHLPLYLLGGGIIINFLGAVFLGQHLAPLAALRAIAVQ